MRNAGAACLLLLLNEALLHDRQLQMLFKESLMLELSGSGRCALLRDCLGVADVVDDDA